MLIYPAIYKRSFSVNLDHPPRGEIMPKITLPSAKALVGKVHQDDGFLFGRAYVKPYCSTDIVRERFVAGESISELAEDYGANIEGIETALRFELHSPQMRRKIVEAGRE